MATQNNSTDVTSWVGWVYFAGFYMILLGALQAMAGLVALFKNTVYVVADKSLWIANYTAWGWAHLLLGLVILAAGSAVMSGKMWGRTLGVIMAGVATIANFAYIPVYPFWSILLVVLDTLVIYALIVHGKEAASSLE